MTSSCMAHDVICKKKQKNKTKQKTTKKDVVRIVTFDLTGLLPTNHIIAYMYITTAYQSL